MNDDEISRNNYSHGECLMKFWRVCVVFPHVSEVGREMTISGAMPWVPWIRGGIFDKGMSTFSDIFS